jgi:hypothetical protein
MTSEEEFELGLQAGTDPQPDDWTARDTAGFTSQTSPWLSDVCDTCGQTFRRGDPVRHDPASGKVIHTEPRLNCGTAITGDRDRQGGGDNEQFMAGLLQAWPPAAGIQVTMLDADDWRVARPGRQSPRCLYCGHTFRAGEAVVICPCRPSDPHCGAAIHRDPVAGLTCWESWRPDSTLSICPVTLTRVEPGPMVEPRPRVVVVR